MSAPGEAKARALLLSYLRPHQRAMLGQLDFFYEHSRNGRVFALHEGEFLLEVSPMTGNPLVWLGIRAQSFWGDWRPSYARSESPPRSDGLLAQVLMLRTNPERLSEACRTTIDYDFGQYFGYEIVGRMMSGRHYYLQLEQ